MPKRGRSSINQYRHYQLKKKREEIKSENRRQPQCAEWSGEATIMPINDGCLGQSTGGVSLIVASDVIADSEFSSGSSTSHFSTAASSAAVVHDEHKLSLARKAKAKADARASETNVQRERRLRKDAAAKAASRASETEVQRGIRLNREAAFKASARASENEAQRANRLSRDAVATSASRQVETTPDRNMRLCSSLQYTANSRGISRAAKSRWSLKAFNYLEKKKWKKQCLGEQHLKKQRLQDQKLETQQSHDRWKIDSSSSLKTSKCIQLTTKMPIQQDTSVAQASQKVTRVLASPVQTTVSKLITRKKASLKQKLLVAGHQHRVMSNLASMWRSRKLCDASISNGSSTVMVHKIVLSAVSPKLFSILKTYNFSKTFFKVKFPEVVSAEALMDFAEYMYTGLLDLDTNILQQLKIIAKQLDIKELQNLCDTRLLSRARQRPASTVTAFRDHRRMPSYVSSTTSKNVTTVQTSSLLTPTSTMFVTAVPTEDIKQEISQNELAQLKEETAGIFEQEFDIASVDTKSGNSLVGADILPTVKIEPVGPDDDKYGQMNKKSYSSSSVSDSSQTPSTTMNSIAVSTSEFSLPFSDTTDSKATTNRIHGTSSKLKSNVFESCLVSGLSPESSNEEKLCSQSRHLRENSFKPLNQTLTTQSIDNIVTSGSNEGVYPVGLFTAGGDSLPLSSMQVTNVKNIGLYKTDDPI